MTTLIDKYSLFGHLYTLSNVENWLTTYPHLFVNVDVKSPLIFIKSKLSKKANFLRLPYYERLSWTHFRVSSHLWVWSGRHKSRTLSSCDYGVIIMSDSDDNHVLAIMTIFCLLSTQSRTYHIDLNGRYTIMIKSRDAY